MTNYVPTNNIQPFKFAHFVDDPNKAGLDVRIPFDFTSTQSYDIDLTSFKQFNQSIGAFKTVYIDNSNNAEPLSITSAQTNQRLTIGAYQQGYFQFMSVESNPRYYAETTGGVVVPIHFINKTIPSCVWNSLSNLQATIVGNISTVTAGGVGTSYKNNVPAVPANLLFTIAANTARKCFEIQNQSAETVTCVLQGGSFIILSPAFAANQQGGGWKCQEYKGSISVYSTSATSQVSSYEI